MDEFPFSVGHVLADRYRIAGTLGRGGMSTVYACDDLKLPGGRWAVKAVPIEQRSAAEQSAETDILCRLRHPNLPTVVDAFETDDFRFLVMEIVEGETLQQRFDKSGRTMPEAEIVGYALQICDCLAYLHAQRPDPVVFRDLKPSNVMIEQGGRVRLIDFGIARRHKPGAGPDTVRLGTIGFAAPEQLVGEQSDPRTDIYALGALLYYLLGGGSCYDFVRQPLAMLNPSVDRQLADFVHRMLSPNREARPSSAEEVKKILRAFAFPKAAPDGNDDTGRKDGFNTRKMWAVGGLYPGAGATFTSVALARVLHHSGYGCALLEWPSGTPSLYHLLFGDNNAPRGYRFAFDVLDQPAVWERLPVWTSGKTVWIPAPPDGIGRPWRSEWTFRLLQWARHFVNIVEIGCSWSDDVLEVCSQSDVVAVVADPSPASWNRAKTKRTMECLDLMRATGKRVVWIANRNVDRFRKNWTDIFPDPPAAVVPALPHDAVVRAVLEGRPVADIEPYRSILFEALQPLVVRLLPGFQRAVKERRRFMRLWSQDGLQRKG